MVQKNIHERIRRVSTLQTDNGSWKFIFEGPVLTDSFYIMTVCALQLPFDELTEKVFSRLVSLQQENGSWKIYQDEKEGNLSATIQAYTALLLSKKFTRSDEEMKRAEQFIQQHGGLKNAHFMTKMMLAVNGLYKYPSYFYFPMTYYLLPSSFPLSMYHCSNYARIHMTPMIICMNKKFSMEHTIDRSFFQHAENGWFRENRDEWGRYFINQMKTYALWPLHLHKAGYKEAEKYMLDRIERNGTLYSYASATFYMIYALLALGYRKNASIFKRAIKGIQSYITEAKAGLHVQNSPSNVWDTGLLTYALQEAGMSENHPVCQKAIRYLLKKQQLTRGDWTVNAPKTSPGGWGFSDSNSFIPDNDDTSAVLRALTRASKGDAHVKKAWEKGVSYLCDMQNNDGGWGAFEKNAYQPIFAHLPIENAKDAMIDDSTADLTGRVLEFLGHYAGYNEKHPSIKKAVQWLIKKQNADGSWYGKWGVCYIYGTWAAVTGLLAVGVSQEHPSIQKAVQWLENIQQTDGGWGESCHSAEAERYVPLSYSTPSQTAWALDTLLMVRHPEAESIQKAVRLLIEEKRFKRESIFYPTGLGLRGGFYIYYESYNEIFPLLALAHFKQKLSK